MSARYFITFDIAVNVAERLMALQEELEEELLGCGLTANWTHPEQLHVSMKYLGEVDGALISHIEQALEKLSAPLFPFQVQSKGVALLPDARRPRHLMVMHDPKGAEVLGLLQRALERELEQIGVELDPRPYKAGIVLGRLRRAEEGEAADGEALAAALERLAGRNFGTSTIRDLVLMRSELGQDGPTYGVCNRFALGSRQRIEGVNQGSQGRRVGQQSRR